MTKNKDMKFTEALESIEKAKQVGDIHSNGKWVWTELPSGKFDWRVIKNGANKETSSESKVETKTNSVSYKDSFAQVGDKVSLKTKTGGTQGEVYEISTSGKTFKLKDDYGNKNDKWFNVADFGNAKITRGETKSNVSENPFKAPKKEEKVEDYGIDKIDRFSDYYDVEQIAKKVATDYLKKFPEKKTVVNSKDDEGKSIEFLVQEMTKKNGSSKSLLPDAAKKKIQKYISYLK